MRRKLAKNFPRAIQKRLGPLGLGGSTVSVAVETRELGNDSAAHTPPEWGADEVEMLFSANPGEEPRPLRKIASGGELSRLTLAVKTVLAAVNRVPTLIFDEIDTGVGGRLARRSGRHSPSCATPSSHLRHAPAADRQFRRTALGGSQAHRPWALSHHDHSSRRYRSGRGACGHAARRIRSRGHAAGGPGDAPGSAGDPMRAWLSEHRGNAPR